MPLPLPRSSRTRRLATAAALVAAGAVAATAITGVASASNGTGRGASTSVSASAGASGSVGAADGRGRRGGMLRDVLHGQVTVKDGAGTKVVDLQRGKLTAASSTAITVASSDGFTATYAVSSSTTVRKARQTVPASSLAVGDDVLVRATAGTATVVRTR